MRDRSKKGWIHLTFIFTFGKNPKPFFFQFFFSTNKYILYRDLEMFREIKIKFTKYILLLLLLHWKCVCVFKYEVASNWNCARMKISLSCMYVHGRTRITAFEYVGKTYLIQRVNVRRRKKKRKKKTKKNWMIKIYSPM